MMTRSQQEDAFVLPLRVQLLVRLRRHITRVVIAGMGHDERRHILVTVARLVSGEETIHLLT